MSQLPVPWLASVVTLFPQMVPGPLGYSLAGRALEEGRWRLETTLAQGRPALAGGDSGAKLDPL